MQPPDRHHVAQLPEMFHFTSEWAPRQFLQVLSQVSDRITQLKESWKSSKDIPGQLLEFAEEKLFWLIIVRGIEMLNV